MLELKTGFCLSLRDLREADAVVEGRLWSGKSLSAIYTSADIPDAFDSWETAHLEELAGDLAYGIQVRRTQAERDQVRKD